MLRQIFRGYWDINWFVTRTLRRKTIIYLIVSLIIFVVGAAKWLAEICVGNISYGGIVLMIIGGFKISRDAKSFVKFWIYAPQYEIPENRIPFAIMNMQIDNDYEESEYAIEKISEDEYIVRSPKVDLMLRKNTFCIKANNKLIDSINEALRGRAEIFEAALRVHFKNSFINNKKFVNEEKVCLWSDLLINSEYLYIYKGTYFHSFLTNELVKRAIENKSESRSERVYDWNNCFPAVRCNNKFIIQPLRTSRMANHIGASTILFTKDKNLVFWRQSIKAQQSCNLLAPTGSGSCDWSDWTHSPSPQRLNDLLRRTMEREFVEESCPLKMKLQGVQMTTCVIGFFRWMSRGGKPEFVGVTKAEAAFSQLKANDDEVEWPVKLDPYPCRNIEEMLDIIVNLTTRPKTIQEKNYFEMSVPLWVNLECLKEALRENPKYWASFFDIKQHNADNFDDVEDVS